MKKINLYLIITLLSLTSCEEKIDNFVPEGHHEDGIHEITVYPGFKGDLSQIIGLRAEYLFREVKINMDSFGIEYFKDSNSCNVFVRNLQPNFNITGFDFDNYFLALIAEDKEYGSVHTCCATYQLRCYLDHNSKTIILKVSSRYRRASAYTNLLNPVRYYSWVSIPKVSGVWMLKVENNLN